ncbi:hypothetical protein B0A54_17660 [Friedmanniomyces endolithicus]|uniref:Uncharacterized protein n=1 Tax=Friedmanniomyces endolithicus TaxID=329885 RepID=A0A4U0TQZ1_9PEZI|nr:hypothetical protein B0A54_17660 [Friedmanniomyces endolithicus]
MIETSAGPRADQQRSRAWTELDLTSGPCALAARARMLVQAATLSNKVAAVAGNPAGSDAGKPSGFRRVGIRTLAQTLEQLYALHVSPSTAHASNVKRRVDNPENCILSRQAFAASPEEHPCI